MELSITFDKLDDILEERPEMATLKKEAIKNLIQAEMDWSTHIDKVDDFVKLVENTTGSDGNQNAIKEKLNYYGKNAESNLWELESFHSLLNVFNYNSNLTLKEIVKELIK
jgi:TnpA family transposase